MSCPLNLPLFYLVVFIIIFDYLVACLRSQGLTELLDTEELVFLTRAFYQTLTFKVVHRWQCKWLRLLKFLSLFFVDLIKFIILVLQHSLDGPLVVLGSLFIRHSMPHVLLLATVQTPEELLILLVFKISPYFICNRICQCAHLGRFFWIFPFKATRALRRWNFVQFGKLLKVCVSW